MSGHAEGNQGTYGGTVVFTADSETLSGNLVSDSISFISVTFKNSTTLTGSVNKAALSLDASSTWSVTGNSYLTSLSDSSGLSANTITNIKGNGYTVYYDKSLSANSWIGGLTYTLSGGGSLTPQ